MPHKILLRSAVYAVLMALMVAILLAWWMGEYGPPEYLLALRTTLWAIGILTMLFGVKYACQAPYDPHLVMAGSRTTIDEAWKAKIRLYEAWKKKPIIYKLRYTILGALVILLAELLAL